MKDFEDLEHEHESLLHRLASEMDEREIVFIQDVKRYLEKAQRAGSVIALPEQRHQIQAILSFWATVIYEHEGVYPRLMLYPTGSEALAAINQVPLAQALAERYDFVELQEAVSRAELLQATSKLPEELDHAYLEARKYLETTRNSHTETWQALHSEDYSQIQHAYDHLNILAREGIRFFFKRDQNRWDPIELVLEQSTELRDHAEQLFVAQILEKVDDYLPRDPDTAHKFLLKVLDRHLSSKVRENLQEKVTQIEAAIDRKREAEHLIAVAVNQDNLMEQWHVLEKARAIFPYAGNVQAMLRETYQALQQEYKEVLSASCLKAERSAQARNYQSALDTVSDAEAQLATWPETALPPDLQQLAERIKRLRCSLESDVATYQVFIDQRNAIEAQLKDDQLSETGSKLLRNMQADARFRALPEAQRFFLDMAPYVDVSSLLAQARLAHAHSDWNSVINLTTDILALVEERAELDEALQQEAQHLFTESAQELQIAEIQTLLTNRDIAEAQNLLKRLLANVDDEKREYLKNRLQDAIAHIERAIAATPSMQDLFEKGLALQEKAPLKWKIAAWKLFRYVSGDPTAPAEREWPPYHISLITIPASKEAQTIAAEIRKQFYSLARSTRNEGDVPRREINMHELAAYAQDLREGGLWQTSDERAVIYQSEFDWADNQAKRYTKQAKWRATEEVWSILKQVYPESGEIYTRLRHAQVQRVLAEARALHHATGVQSALAYFKGLQEDPLGGAWELKLAEANLLMEIGEYEQAAAALSVAESQVEQILGTSKTEIQRGRETLQLLQRARNFQKHGLGQEALRLLNTAMQKKAKVDVQLIEQQYRRVFDEQQQQSLARAKREVLASDVEEYVDKGLALLNLRRLQSLAMRSDVALDFSADVELYCANFARVINAILEKTQRFLVQYATSPLADVDTEADRLMRQIQNIIALTEVCSSEKGHVILDELEKLSDLKKRLVRLRELLSRKVLLLEQATERDDFHHVHQLLEEVKSLGLTDQLEARAFIREAAEWEEIHTYLWNAIQSVRQQFEAEDFRAVIEKLNHIVQSPNLRIDHTPYRNITQTDYNHIYALMAPKLQVSHPVKANEVLIGWEKVLEIAHMCEREIMEWSKWYEDCRPLENAVHDAIHEVEKYDPKQPAPPLCRQYLDWEKVISATSELLEHLGRRLSLESPPPIIHARKTHQYVEAGAKSQRIAATWQQRAKTRCEELSVILMDPERNMPALSEFNAAVRHRDRERLAQLLERARMVGTEDSMAEDLIKQYEPQLETMPDPSIVTRLFRWLKAQFAKLRRDTTEQDVPNEG